MPMVKAEDSWLCQQHSGGDSPNFNHVCRVLPPSKQNNVPSCVNPSRFSADVVIPGLSVSGPPGLKAVQANVAHALSCCLPPLVESSPSPSNPNLKESHSPFPRRFGAKHMPNGVTSPGQKRFLVFDQSGQYTRLFLSTFGSSSQNPLFVPVRPAHVCHICNAEQVNAIEQMSQTMPTTQGASGEDQIIGERSEFHENTDEINALLYSDDDEYDHNDGYSENGELTSTGHSPITVKGSIENYEQVGDITAEFGSSDGSSKRQRLLDGGYKKSLVVDPLSLVKYDRSSEYDSDAESNCGKSRTQGKVMGSILGTKKQRKGKIHETLKILENIIPGSKGKEPLLIIDEAISYLKSLKLKARALGLSYP